MYRFPAAKAATQCVFINTSDVSAYGGVEWPEDNYYTERVIDVTAREVGIDPLELRQRNVLRPKDMPYLAASGVTYDSGDFPAALDHATELAKNFRRRKRQSKKHGLRRGIGIGCFLEVTAPASPEMGGILFNPDGTVTIVIGMLDYG
jgi:carbon-monoxide dehydrogenase large subunit